MRKMTLALGFAVAATFGTAASAASLVTNPGFTAGLTGYTVTPGTDIQVDQGYTYIYEVSGGTTGSVEQYSNYFATFGQHNEDNVSSLLTNTFDTIAGQKYTLSFDYGQFADVSGTQVLSFAVGALTGSITNPNVSIDLSTLFQHYSYDFIGTGSPLQVAFSISPSATFKTDGLLDNVSVVAAVPELSTWAMFIMGFGAVGAAYRRRSVKVAFA